MRRSVIAATLGAMPGARVNDCRLRKRLFANRTNFSCAAAKPGAQDDPHYDIARDGKDWKMWKLRDVGLTYAELMTTTERVQTQSR